MATLRSKEILFLMYIPSWQGNASLLQGGPGPVGVTQSIVRVKNGYAQSKKRPLWVERSFSPPHFHHSLQTDHTPGCEFLHLLRLKKKIAVEILHFFQVPRNTFMDFKNNSLKDSFSPVHSLSPSRAYIFGGSFWPVFWCHHNLCLHPSRKIQNSQWKACWGRVADTLCPENRSMRPQGDSPAQEHRLSSTIWPGAAGRWHVLQCLGLCVWG